MLSCPTFLVVLESLGVDTIGVVDGTVPFRHSDTDGAGTGQVSGNFKDKLTKKLCCGGVCTGCSLNCNISDLDPSQDLNRQQDNKSL
jgi:hypothetical protein